MRCFFVTSSKALVPSSFFEVLLTEYADMIRVVTLICFCDATSLRCWHLVTLRCCSWACCRVDMLADSRAGSGAGLPVLACSGVVALAH